MQPAMVAVATAAFVVAAAKAHGRQLRLEREAHGILARSSESAWLQALWRRDRLTLWGLWALLSIGSVATHLAGWRSGWTWLAFDLAMALGASFLAVGTWSMARLRKFARNGADGAVEASANGSAGWARSLGWLALAVALGGGALAIAWS